MSAKANTDEKTNGLRFGPNKAMASKCFTGKILMPENRVFEIKPTIGTEYCKIERWTFAWKSLHGDLGNPDAIGKSAWAKKLYH